MARNRSRRSAAATAPCFPPALWRDPAFAIESPAWGTFARWEWNVERCAGYLGDRDWDLAWVLEAYSSDDEDEAFEEDEDDADEDEDDDLDFSIFGDEGVPGARERSGSLGGAATTAWATADAAAMHSAG
jgi:hypothetical protein